VRERLWNLQQLRELRRNQEVSALVDDRRHPLVAPTKLAMGVGPTVRQLQIEGRRVVGDVDVRKVLGIGALSGADALQRIKDGSRLQFRVRGSNGRRNAGVYRLFPPWNEPPFARGRVLRSANFTLEAHQVTECTVRIECSPHQIVALHIEPWLVGTDGDLDRPLESDLLFLFPADAQILDETTPVSKEKYGS
jgi:hypothetical protein